VTSLGGTLAAAGVTRGKSRTSRTTTRPEAFTPALERVSGLLAASVAAGGWFTTEERQALEELADAIAALLGESVD
jgi:hypothetical protein